MAPSVKGTSSRVSKRQAELRSYAKVTKNSIARFDLEAGLKEAVLKPVANVKTAPQATFKRKRIQVQVESESETERDQVDGAAARSKKLKLQLPTPRSLQTENDGTTETRLSPLEFRQLSLESKSLSSRPSSSHELPQTLQDLVSLHDAFIRAFTLHTVHHGKSAPADLATIMASVTRLWKKRTVRKEDIQRMLAMYELDDPSASDPMAGQLLKHKNGPFRLTLTLSGGDAVRYNVEYLGSAKCGNGNRELNPSFDEKGLQQSYEAQVRAVFTSQCSREQADWLFLDDGDVSQFPRLELTMGVQTQARKLKAATARKEILGLSSQAQTRSGAQFPSATSISANIGGIETPAVVKDRTLSLLERVRAKALASSTVTPDTPEAIVRRYAMGRIQEVVEILRMLQQRKLASNFNSSVHSSPSKVRGKVSFSLHQLINDIKGSLASPLGEAEIKMCITILANDVPGMWVSVFTVGKVQSVVLNGHGLSGIEVKKMLDERI
ncbi:hypothetical protein KCU88_g5161, partial [Aureobasidium melanogenum]